MNPRSLRFRVTSLYSALVVACLLLFGISVYVALQNYLDQQLKASLSEQARSIGEKLVVDVDARGESYVVAEINESYAPEISGRFIRVTRQDGSVLYQSSDPRDASFRVGDVPVVSELQRRGYAPKDFVAGSQHLVIQGFAYSAPGGKHFLIETGASYEPIEKVLHGLRLVFGLGLPVFALLAIAGGLLLMRNALSPVRAITEQAERISSVNIGERLPVAHTGDELERLSISLNRMMARLEESFEHISRFSADVSHELRTPLTILRGELEALVQNHHLSADLLEPLGDTLEEVERLAKIVEQLLIITRLDVGEAGIERVRVDLGELVATTVDQMRLLAEEKLIALRFDITPGAEVEGDRLRLKQVLVNLIDNAIKYTPEGGGVMVAVHVQEQNVMLEVSDNGIGIDAESLPHVFERFYRADPARSRESGGAGLGLSIVKAICAAHNGHIAIQSEERQGTTVRMELPAAAADGRAASKLETAWNSVVRSWS